MEPRLHRHLLVMLSTKDGACGLLSMSLLGQARRHSGGCLGTADAFLGRSGSYPDNREGILTSCCYFSLSETPAEAPPPSGCRGHFTQVQSRGGDPRRPFGADQRQERLESLQTTVVCRLLALCRVLASVMESLLCLQKKPWSGLWQPLLQPGLGTTPVCNTKCSGQWPDSALCWPGKEEVGLPERPEARHLFALTGCSRTIRGGGGAGHLDPVQLEHSRPCRGRGLCLTSQRLQCLSGYTEATSYWKCGWRSGWAGCLFVTRAGTSL